MAWDDMFTEFQRMQEDMERFWRNFRREGDHPLLEQKDGKLTTFRKPISDLRESESAFLLDIEMPGAKKEDIKVDVQDNGICVSYQDKVKKELNKEGARFLQARTRNYQRAFSFPAPVQADRAKAKYQDGILHIEVPKQEVSRKKTLHIA